MRGDHVGLLRQLRFRFGFLIQRTGATSAPAVAMLRGANWTERTVDGFTLWTHPESRVAVETNPDLTTIIIGDAFAEPGGNLPDAAEPPADEGDWILPVVGRLTGRFAFLAVGHDRLRVFNDPVGSRSIYYHAREPLAVASHVELLAAAISAARSPEMAAYVADPAYRNRKVKYLPGDRTLFDSVLAVPPSHHFDSRSNAIRRHWPLRPNRSSTLSEVQDCVVDSIRSLARYLEGTYEPVLGLTGGVDSRLSLAIFRDSGLDVETVTWSKANLLPGEADKIDGMVAKLGLRHDYITLPVHAGQIGRLAATNDGGACLRSSRLCTGLRRRYGKRRSAMLIRGWGGEVVRVYYSGKSHALESLQPTEMTRAYMAAPTREKMPSASRAHQAATERCFADFYERAGYAAIETLGFDPNDIFYLEHRMGMWAAAANNELDAAMANMVAFNGRRLFDTAFALPSQQRKDKRILLDIAARLDPIYTDIPVTKASDTLQSRIKSIVVSAVRNFRRM